jgi:acyl-CoA synthetase (AMP-forming)/AMP-acid ligase II
MSNYPGAESIRMRGRLEIMDRKKDIIISGGENISTVAVDGVTRATGEAVMVKLPDPF